VARAKIGLIGLGQMGGPIAGHIVKGQFPLFACDLDEARRQKAARAGAKICANVGEVGRQVDIAIVIVGYDNEVWDVCAGKDGLIDNMRKGSTIAILSTITVATMERLVRRAKRKGIHVLDTPVTRAEEGAIAGNLLLLGSGDEAAFKRARPVFRTFCGDIFHLGQAGCGQVAKICNNMLLWISVAANCETIGLAEKYGLNKAELTAALMISTGTNGTLHRWEKMTMPWMHKDLTIGLAFAESLNLGLPMAGLTKQLVRVMKLPRIKA